jgi:SAM-dependent methyltransferase
MTETSKARARREKEGFFDKYITSPNGIDIGYGGDLVVPGARGWDTGDGDGTYLATIPDASFDWVYSSHCLEHISDPLTAVENWWRVLKPQGHLIIMVPDEDLYEQGFWPSRYNGDHKFSYTLSKNDDRPHSLNLLDLISDLPNHKLIYARIIDTNYRYDLHAPIDQTLGDAEAGCEIVVKKLA